MIAVSRHQHPPYNSPASIRIQRLTHFWIYEFYSQWKYLTCVSCTSEYQSYVWIMSWYCLSVPLSDQIWLCYGIYESVFLCISCLFDRCLCVWAVMSCVMEPKCGVCGVQRLLAAHNLYLEWWMNRGEAVHTNPNWFKPPKCLTPNERIFGFHKVALVPGLGYPADNFSWATP